MLLGLLSEWLMILEAKRSASIKHPSNPFPFSAIPHPFIFSFFPPTKIPFFLLSLCLPSHLWFICICLCYPTIIPSKPLLCAKSLVANKWGSQNFTANSQSPLLQQLTQLTPGGTMQEETSRDRETEKKEKPRWMEDRQGGSLTFSFRTAQLDVLIPRQVSSCIGQSVPARQ